MVLEVMGRYAGWIALSAAIAGGADNCLIPEIPYDLNKVIEKINKRSESGRNYSIIVVAEGAKPSPIIIIIGPITTGGNNLSSQFLPANLIIIAIST